MDHPTDFIGHALLIWFSIQSPTNLHSQKYVKL
jgi:hypothetical protein